MTEVRTPRVQAETRGSIPEGAVSFAIDRVSSLLRMASEPVLFARVNLSMAADPAVRRPASAQIKIDLNGRLIRARAAGVTVREAVEHACDRLRIRLQRASRNWAAIRGSRPVARPGEGRHQSLPSTPRPYFPRPPQDRVVMRRKSFALARSTPDEAVSDAELLGYDFHLFTEKSTGEDGVVYRAGDGYRLALAHRRGRRLGPIASPITVSKTPAPCLSVAGAKARLEAARQPFLFFVNSETGRGNLIYHRYDGHYGLVEPAS
jgi:Sigma 54 modulation/S30EA ribosomal protein C terminus